jgi:hypothetical protein
MYMYTYVCVVCMYHRYQISVYKGTRQRHELVTDVMARGKSSRMEQDD